MARAAASASAAGENRVGKEPSSTARESDITKKAHCQVMAAEGVRAARSQAHRATRSTARASSGDAKPGVFFCARAQNTMAAAKTSGPSGAPREASSPHASARGITPLPICAATRENAAAGAIEPPTLARAANSAATDSARRRSSSSPKQEATSSNRERDSGSMLREEANLRARNSAQAASSSAAKRTASSAARRILFWRAFFPA